MTLLATFTVPYPPSVNAIWQPAPQLRVSVPELIRRLKAGESWRKLITATTHASKAATDYRASVAAAILQARVRGELGEQPLIGVIDIRAIAHPPLLERKRDTNNLWKAMLDALTYAEVILDDSQFVDDRIRWGEPRRGPCVRIVIGRPVPSTDDEYLGLFRPRARIANRGTREPDLTTQGSLL